MIKSIQSTSPSVSVSQVSVPHIGNNGQGAGQLRYNVSTQGIEVYDGSSWINMNAISYVGLQGNTEEVLRWAGEKMYEEKELKAKMEKYPTLKSAYEQYKLVEALVYEEDKVGT